MIGGGRYLDMYLSGGTAVLGHRPGGVNLRLKNTMARGLWSGYPSPWPGRLKKELKRLLPEFPHILIFSGIFHAESWLAERFPEMEIRDPAVEGAAPGHHALWRPFCPEGYAGTASGSGVDVLIPVLPFPASFLPGIVCCRRGVVSPEDLNRWSGSSVSPVLLSGLTRAAAMVRELLSEKTESSKKVKFNNGKGGDIHPLNRILKMPGWDRRGPYLKYTGPPEEYKENFKSVLNSRILLPPSPGIPAVVPGLYSRGEIAPLLKVFSSGKES